HAEPLAKDVLLLKENQNALPHLLDLLLDGKKAPNPEAFSKWFNLLLHIENEKPSSEEIQKFKELISTLKKTRALPGWLVFSQDTRELPLSELSLIETLIHEQESFKEKKEMLDGFSQQESFQGAWDDFKSRLSIWATSERLQVLQSASPMTRRIAFQTM